MNRFNGLNSNMGAVSALKKKASSFALCEEGLAFVEFALSSGLFLLLTFGTIEVSHYILIARRLQIAANQQTNLITSIDDATITPTEMTAALNSVKTMMAPYPFGAEGY